MNGSEVAVSLWGYVFRVIESFQRMWRANIFVGPMKEHEVVNIPVGIRLPTVGLPYSLPGSPSHGYEKKVGSVLPVSDHPERTESFSPRYFLKFMASFARAPLSRY